MTDLSQEGVIFYIFIFYILFKKFFKLLIFLFACFTKKELLTSQMLLVVRLGLRTKQWIYQFVLSPQRESNKQKYKIFMPFAITYPAPSAIFSFSLSL